MESWPDGALPLLLEADDDELRSVEDVDEALRMLAYWLHSEKPVTPDVRFVQDLVTRFPEFDETHYMHAFNPGEVLPHVFMGHVELAVERSIVADDSGGLYGRAVLAFLGEQFGQRDRNVDIGIDAFARGE